ncbi:MAG: hypothetical protein KDE65_08970, partial [Burkholderiaceae bacterium]|nr:hypothetical protein [Burkholderiaceae bacterium]
PCDDSQQRFKLSHAECSLNNARWAQTPIAAPRSRIGLRKPVPMRHSCRRPDSMEKTAPITGAHRDFGATTANAVAQAIAWRLQDASHCFLPDVSGDH